MPHRRRGEGQIRRVVERSDRLIGSQLLGDTAERGPVSAKRVIRAKLSYAGAAVAVGCGVRAPSWTIIWGAVRWALGAVVGVAIAVPSAVSLILGPVLIFMSCQGR
jgi:hypothetical protein